MKANRCQFLPIGTRMQSPAGLRFSVCWTYCVNGYTVDTGQNNIKSINSYPATTPHMGPIFKYLQVVV